MNYFSLGMSSDRKDPLGLDTETDKGNTFRSNTQRNERAESYCYIDKDSKKITISNNIGQHEGAGFGV